MADNSPTNYDIPSDPVERLRYYDDEFLVEQDFIDDQAYHIAHQRRHDRLHHVAGILEGLEVSVLKFNPLTLKISRGSALDSDGRHVILVNDEERTCPNEPNWLVLSFAEITLGTPIPGNKNLDKRFRQAPEIAFVSECSAKHIVLGKLTRVGNNIAYEPTGRVYSGLRLPGPKAPAIALRASMTDAAADLSGALNVAGTLTVLGDVLKVTRLDAKPGQLAINGQTTTQTLQITGANGEPSLTVAGEAKTANITTTGNHAISGATSTATLSVTGSTSLTGETSTRNITTTGNHAVSGETTTATLRVTGRPNTTSLVVVGETTTNSLTVAGATTTATLRITGGSNATSLLVTGEASVATLRVTDSIIAKSQVIQGNTKTFSLTVDRATNLVGETWTNNITTIGSHSVSGTLLVKESATIVGWLNVAGEATLAKLSTSGDLTVEGTGLLRVNQSAIIAKLVVVGDTTATGNLSVAGTTSTTTLKVTGSPNTTNLEVTGKTTTGSISAAGDLSVAGTTSTTTLKVTGSPNTTNLEVTGKTTSGSISATGDLSVSGTTSTGKLTVTGDTSTGTLTVKGTTLTDTLNVTGKPGETRFIVAADALLRGSLTVYRSLTVGEDKTPGSITVKGSLSATGETTTGNLTVKGSLSTTGETTTGNLTVKGLLSTDEGGYATLRVADLVMGHSTRGVKNSKLLGGSVGRALVDYPESTVSCLHLNFAGDWARTRIGGTVIFPGDVIAEDDVSSAKSITAERLMARGDDILAKYAVSELANIRAPSRAKNVLSVQDIDIFPAGKNQFKLGKLETLNINPDLEWKHTVVRGVVLMTKAKMDRSGNGNLVVPDNTTLVVDGNARTSGNWQTGYADLAEVFLPSSSSLEPGDVVAIDEVHQEKLCLTTRGHQQNILGVVSEQPGFVLGSTDDVNGVPLALAGRVPVKVTLEGGPIAIGDFLTSSGTPGHAMKATRSCRVIGMALTAFGRHGDPERGRVTVFVNLTWWSNC